MCGIVVEVDGDGDGDRVVRVRGDAEHPLSHGYTCPKGRSLPELHHHPRRLDHPWTRTAGPTSWDAALDDLAARVGAAVEAHGPSAVAMYLASGSAFDASGRRIAERFLRQLGSPQKYTATTIDTPCKPLVAELMGGWSGLTPVLDVDACELLLLLGTNPVVSHGHSNGMPDPVVKLRAIAERGELWVADPRRTETAALATRHLPVRASTDWVLLAHLVRCLLEPGGGADAASLASHTQPDDVDRLRTAVAPYDAAVTAAATGLPAGDLDALVAAVRRRGKIAALTGTGCSMARTANVTEWLLWALHIVTGSYEHPGTLWFNPGFLLRMDGRRLEPSDGAPGPGPASRPELPRRFDEYPCAGLVSEIEAGTVRALFVVGGNPLTVFPEPDRLAAALATLDVVAVSDVVETETTAVATHVLPAVDQLERADVPWMLDAYQLEMASQYTPAVVAAGAERRPVWWQFAQLGRRLGLSVLPGGLDADGATDDDVIAQVARERFDELRAAPTAIVADRPTSRWVHERLLPDGRWRLAPPALVAQLAELGSLAEATTRVPAPLVLTPRRQLRTMNSQLRDVGARRERAEVLLHPADAAELGGGTGVVDGDLVEVASAHGALVGVARVDERGPRGAVSLTHGWDRPNVGRLTSSEQGVDPLTGMVWQSGLPVEVRPWDSTATT
jgi:anaerobic selenocysteine-containing dehydrogenase